MSLHMISTVAVAAVQHCLFNMYAISANHFRRLHMHELLLSTCENLGYYCLNNAMVTAAMLQYCRVLAAHIEV